jgi:transcriptional regulator with XRE-family HTH domain
MQVDTRNQVTGDRKFQTPLEGTASQSKAIANMEDFGVLRTRSRLLSDDISRGHTGAIATLLNREQNKLERDSAMTLLEDLSDHGFSWRQIARMIGVSVPAVQKWRKGEGLSAERRGKLARVGAVMQLLERNAIVTDVAAWCSLPIVTDASITPIDLITDDELELVYIWAEGHEDGASVLDKYRPAWRNQLPDDGFEVFEAADGNLSIRSKG